MNKVLYCIVFIFIRFCYIVPASYAQRSHHWTISLAIFIHISSPTLYFLEICFCIILPSVPLSQNVSDLFISCTLVSYTCYILLWMTLKLMVVQFHKYVCVCVHITIINATFIFRFTCISSWSVSAIYGHHQAYVIAAETEEYQFWGVTLCSPLEVNHCFRGTRHPQLQDWRRSYARNQCESRSVVFQWTTTALYPKRWFSS
jgi:hypothetical protein